MEHDVYETSWPEVMNLFITTVPWWSVTTVVCAVMVGEGPMGLTMVCLSAIGAFGNFLANVGLQREAIQRSFREPDP